MYFVIRVIYVKLVNTIKSSLQRYSLKYLFIWSQREQNILLGPGEILKKLRLRVSFKNIVTKWNEYIIIFFYTGSFINAVPQCWTISDAPYHHRRAFYY